MQTSESDEANQEHVLQENTNHNSKQSPNQRRENLKHKTKLPNENNVIQLKMESRLDSSAFAKIDRLSGPWETTDYDMTKYRYRARSHLVSKCLVHNNS